MPIGVRCIYAVIYIEQLGTYAEKYDDQMFPYTITPPSGNIPTPVM